MSLPSRGDAVANLLGHDWWVGLDSWVLQDGNYTDFVSGERRQFALELAYRRDRRLRRVPPPSSASARHTGSAGIYEVTGQLIRTSAEPHADAFVLDFGLRAYSHWMVLADGETTSVGDWVSGEIALSVDPFFYKDELARLEGMPALVYTWTVLEIEVETTPTVLVEPEHPKYVGPDRGPRRVRDRERESWRSIERTRTWDDDGSYRLRCHLHDVEPTLPPGG